MNSKTCAILVDHDSLGGALGGPAILDDTWFAERLGPVAPVSARVAYGDWGAQRESREALSGAGFRLVEAIAWHGKNQGDIQLSLDAQELAIRDGIRRFVVASGGDLAPIVSTLLQIGCEVHAMVPSRVAADRLSGLACAVSILQGARPRQRVAPKMPTVPNPLIGVARIAWLCVNVLPPNQPIDAGALRKTIDRINSGFDPRSVGARNFGEVLESLEAAGIVRIHRDSGALRVTAPG